MKSKIIILVMVFSIIVATASAHPGKIDSNGGHTCKKNCEKWGLKDGEYHYHNTPTPTPTPSLNGDLNDNGLSADAGDLVMMKRTSIGEIPADFRCDLNDNDQLADAGDLVMMKRASIGEIDL